MEQLFAIQCSNEYASLLSRDISIWMEATANLNRSPLRSAWPDVHLYVHAQRARRPEPTPDIAPVHQGALAFRTESRDRLFPSHEGLEFLPVKVGDEDWFLLNCMNTIPQIDEQRSEVHRDTDGTIFAVMKLFVPDGMTVPEIFTIADSNRAQLFTTSAFKTRVESSGLQGITFQSTDLAPNYRQRAGL